jgi:hypothetical protein
MIRYILLALVLYVVYKVVFDVIVPVFRATRHVRRQFRDMQQQHMQQQGQQAPTSQAPGYQQTTQPKKQPSGDYIDFEEIK